MSMVAKMWFAAILLVNLFMGSRAQSTNTMMGIADDEMTEPPDRHTFNPSYDFVIVGAGAGGSVLASRLTEDPDVTVLLIEAGQPEPVVAGIPGLSFFDRHSDMLWYYKSEPNDNYCNGFTHGGCSLSVGKVMGGSTTVTDMSATRGIRHDYDNWAALGNTGWDYNSTLPYFKKLEKTSMADLQNKDETHGYSGPTHIEYGSMDALGEAFMKAGGENGWPTYIDGNGGNQVGFFKRQLVIKDGARLSASRLYLHPIHKRPNLHVTKYSLVTKINFENPTTASGVTFEKDGKSFSVTADKEVLLTAGTIKTPQLLMLSGIGPEKHLKDLGIPVVADLPVGENLKDHLKLFGITFDTNVTMESADTDESTDTWPSEKKGTPSSLNSAAAYLDTLNTTNKDGWPDIVLLAVPSNNDPKVFEDVFGFTSETYNDLYPRTDSTNSILTVIPILQRQKSSGSILLRSKDPRSSPKIIPNYWGDAKDVQTIIRGVRHVEALANTAAFRAVNATLRRNGPRRCTETFLSDEYIGCLCKEVALSANHYSGTCSMGKVVDENLKVNGIAKLRVVDASVMPQIPAAQLMIPTLMVAERAADLIKHEWGLFNEIENEHDFLIPSKMKTTCSIPSETDRTCQILS